MSNSSYDYNQIFQNKFNPAYRELALLERKIKQQEGYWIFRCHCYSKEALLNSPHFDRVHSIAKKIGSDTRYWLQNGRFPAFAQAIYDSYRGDLESQLWFVYRAIQNRRPTWWEEAKGAIWGAINMILGKLPRIILGLLPFKSKLMFLPYLRN